MGNYQDLGERLLGFAVNVIKLVEMLPNSLSGKRIGDQLLRSGTSVGANYEEAQGAESKKDFIHKLQISLKEIREANFWLRLLKKSQIMNTAFLDRLVDESNQLKAILSKSVVTAKEKKN